MPSITRGGSSCFLGPSEDWNIYDSSRALIPGQFL
uniref:Uncharacterized protein n=1 Tax=Moniliophthora roreri TaxID=221103 RepID=A0A0W0F5Z5_MONRR